MSVDPNAGRQQGSSAREQWQRDGAVLICGLIPAARIRAAHAAAAAEPDLTAAPRWDDAWGVPAGHGLHHFPFGELRAATPGDGGREAPTAASPLNRLVLSSSLAAVAAELLECEDLRLVHGGLVTAGGDAASCRQEVRGEPFALVPERQARPDAVVALIPLDAATARAPADVLFARFGTPAGVATAATFVGQGAPGGITVRVVLRRSSAGYIQADSFNQRCFAPAMLSPLSPAQRVLLSIPAVGHPFWTQATATAVAARHEGWDAAPYRISSLVAKEEGAGHNTETKAPNRRRVGGDSEPGGGGGARDSVCWEYPAAANPLSEATAVLRPEQVAQWHERGFLVVDGIWPPELIAAAAAAATDLQTPELPDGEGDPTVGADSHFPHEHSALNEVVLHPRVLAMVRQLLNGTAEFYVSAWCLAVR